MKTKTIAIVIAALSLAGVSTLSAQDQGPEAGGPPPRGHRPPPSPIMAALDVNKDGVLDAKEIADASTALLTLDKNGDGSLSADEVRPPRPAGAPDEKDAPAPPSDDKSGKPRPTHRPMPPVVAALDANHDGVIDANEIANASAALLTLDKNKDGQLTQDEIRPARPEGHGPGGPDGRRGPGGPGGPDGRRPHPPQDPPQDAQN